MSLQTKPGLIIMHMSNINVAPSPEQPLNGQGVLRIPRSEPVTVDDNGNCSPTVVLTTPNMNGCEGSGVEKVNTNSAPLINNNGMDKDTALENKGSNDFTLEPYIPNVNNKAPSWALKTDDITSRPDTGFITREKRRKKQYKPDPTLIHFDSLFGRGTWSRYLVIKTSKAISAAKLEFLLLSKCPSKDMNFRLINPNEWLVETTTKEQSEIFQSISDLDGIDVSIHKHDNLNSIFGTVILPENNDSDGLPDEQVLFESLRLRCPNTQKVEVYQLPNRKMPSK